MENQLILPLPVCTGKNRHAKKVKLLRREGFLRAIEINEMINKSKELTGISLFSGAGGADCGFAMAGYTIRVMVEQDKSCCNTLKANWHAEELLKRDNINSKKDIKKHMDWYHEPEPVILQRDITKTTTQEILEAGDLQIGEAFIVFGGSPCQGFSTANPHRCLEDPRNRLIWEFWRVVNEAMPRSFFFENVPGMVQGKKYPVIIEFSKKLANSGYDVIWDILDAADYGVPQRRKRVIMMGKRIDAAALINDRIQYHIACMPGEVTHPDWFIKKHKLD